MQARLMNRLKKGKIPFPVAVRGRETSVLQFPNFTTEEEMKALTCESCPKKKKNGLNHRSVR